MKVRSAISSLIICILSTGLAATVAAETGALQATMDGGQLALEKVGRYHCHDLDSPVITCFQTSAEVELAVKGWMDRLGAEQGVAAVSYVRIWEHTEREGASMYLSADYANLSSIGWNDRISSFRSVNGGAGTFYHDAQMHGTLYGFCCNEIVDNVGGAHNDTFSSVERS